MKTRRNAQPIGDSPARRDFSSRAQRRKVRSIRRTPPHAPSTADVPSTELAPIGPHPTDSDRDARGRFTRNNNGHLSHGADSEQRTLALEPLRRAWVADILRDKGYTDHDEPPRAFGLAVEAFAAVAVKMAGVSTHITEAGGPISAKGRTRRALDAYLKLVDRFVRLAAHVEAYATTYCGRVNV